MDNAIVSVVRALHWSPNDIKNLYLDDADFFGLMFWYDDVDKHNEQLKGY